MSRAGAGPPPENGGAGREAARISELGFGQKHASPDAGEVELLVGGWIEGAAASGLSVRVRVLSPDGAPAGETRCAVVPGGGGSFHAALRLADPPRWWLAGLGAPALHTVEIGLETPGGERLDTASRRVGLRTLCCESGPDGTRALVCNGVRVFARGAEWGEGCAAAPELAVAAAADANFNALRLPSGAPPPPESFFDACDESGIAVLGVAGIDGGADSGQGGDAGTDADDAGADAEVAAGAMTLHSCIPDNPLSEPDDDTGFETARSVVSWAAPETLEEEVPGALGALNGTEMGSRTALRGGPPALASAILAAWPMPKSPAGWVWLSQLAQAGELRRRVAAARASFFQGGGRPPFPAAEAGLAPTGLFWAPLQSARAGADASSVDAAGRWKALHYAAARMFAPEAVFALPGTGAEVPRAVRVVDRAGAGRATVFSWRLTAMDGETLAAGSSPVSPGFAGAEALPLPDTAPFFARRGRADLALWLALRDPEGCVVSRDCALFVPPRALRLQDPELSVDCAQLDGAESERDGEQVFRVSVSAAAPAFGVFLETPGLPALFEDSFFGLDPDETVELHVATLRRVSEAEFRAALRVRSLFDL